MYTTLSTVELRNRLFLNSDNGFTESQCDIIADWLEYHEEEDECEYEYDPAAIREQFTAYESIYELSEVIHGRQHPKPEVMKWFVTWSEANAANWRSLSGGPGSTFEEAFTRPASLVVYLLDHCDNDVAIGSGS